MLRFKPDSKFVSPFYPRSRRPEVYNARCIYYCETCGGHYNVIVGIIESPRNAATCCSQDAVLKSYDLIFELDQAAIDKSHIYRYLK